MKNRSYLATLAGLAATLLPGPARADEYRDRLGHLRLDEVQYVATHNSYHLAPDASVRFLLTRERYQLEDVWPGPRLALALAYTHLPLTTQLELGLRGFELDLHDDPDGGLYAHPGVLRSLTRHKLTPDAPYDLPRKMQQPGYKVFHQTDYDQRSTCALFVDCLQELADWSRSNPSHAPIFLFVEFKTGVAKPLTADYVAPRKPPFDAVAWKRFQAEVKRVLPRDALLTPADVQRDAPTLVEGIKRYGWPTLGAASGKIVLMLLDSEARAQSYLAALDGETPLLFVSERPKQSVALRGKGEAGWVTLPEPDDSRIEAASRASLLSFTRADAETEEARSNDARRRDQAFASGANFISTDYPYPDRRLSGYEVRFGDQRFVRCNPVRSSRCQSTGAR